MWPMLIAALASAALGAKKNADQKKASRRDQAIQAQIAQYSPWTGMKAENVPQGNSATADIASGAIGGLGVGQAIQSGMNQDTMNAQQGQLIGAQANYYNSLANKGGSAGAMGGNNITMNDNMSQEDPDFLAYMKKRG